MYLKSGTQDGRSKAPSRAGQWNTRRQRARAPAPELQVGPVFPRMPRLFGNDPGLFAEGPGELFNDGRLSHTGPFPCLQPQVFAEIIDGVLHRMEVAMKSTKLGPEPLSGIFRTLLVGDN